ncbi:MAG: 16S rRNA (cytosine(1402)-N(4))-methyltransferase RsmH [Candidatus Delongbacteria bacterium]|nr:16S rRNA (cytosine(1402)-N(4))-methyltransferase RsmH [Candidatus Delongbacteria bacterium]
MEYHVPVMAKEVLLLLEPKENKKILDCTLGGGGHTRLFLDAIGENGLVVGIDRDIEAINRNKDLENLPNFKMYNIPFDEVLKIDLINFGLKFDGVLLDLGVSSRQLDSAIRGFTFRDDARLDMRMGEGSDFDAEYVVNNYTFDDLVKIFKEYGEEKFSKKIASRIISQREKEPIKSTNQLKNIVESCVPGKHSLKSVARIFQAIRIDVNDELGQLKRFLDFVLEILNPGGRVAVIAYHSLEDRIVKNFINEGEKECVCPKEFPVCICNKVKILKKITRKALEPTEEEIKLNSRARSAKMRVFEKV